MLGRVRPPIVLLLTLLLAFSVSHSFACVSQWRVNATVLPLSGAGLLLTGVQSSGVALTGVSIVIGGQSCQVESVAYENGTHSIECSTGSYATPDVYAPITLQYVSGTRSCSFSQLDMYVTDKCPVEGYFASPIADALSGEPFNCRACPSGGVCPGGPRLWSKNGYWNDKDIIFPTSCLDEDRCLGGRGPVCDTGFDGTFCGGCDSEYFIDGSKCAECDQGVGSGLIFFSEFLFITMFVFMTVFSEDASVNDFIGAIISLQIIVSVGSKLSEDVPSFAILLFRFLSLVNLDLQFVKYITCGKTAIPGGSSFDILFFANMTTIISVTGVILVMAYIVDRSGFRPGRFVRSATVSATVWYISLTVKSLDGLYCVPKAGSLYLQADMAVECYKGLHIATTVVSVIILASLTIAFPIAVYINIYQLRHVLYKFHVLSRLGFIYNPYKPEYKYFRALLFAVTFLLAFASTVLSRNEIARFVVRFVSLSVVFTLFILWQPLAVWWKNVIWVAASIIAVCGSLLDLMEVFNISTEGKAVEAIALIFVILACIIVFLYLVVFIARFYFWLVNTSFCTDCMSLKTIDELENDHMKKSSSSEMVPTLDLRRVSWIEEQQIRSAGTKSAPSSGRRHRHQNSEALEATHPRRPSSGRRANSRGSFSGITPGASARSSGKTTPTAGGDAVNPSYWNLRQLGRSTYGQSVYADTSGVRRSSSGDLSRSAPINLPGRRSSNGGTSGLSKQSQKREDIDNDKAPLIKDEEEEKVAVAKPVVVQKKEKERKRRPVPNHKRNDSNVIHAINIQKAIARRNREMEQETIKEVEENKAKISSAQQDESSPIVPTAPSTNANSPPNKEKKGRNRSPRKSPRLGRDGLKEFSRLASQSDLAGPKEKKKKRKKSRKGK